MFGWKGKTVGGGCRHEVSQEEWKSCMLYMYTNIEMEQYFEWVSPFFLSHIHYDIFPELS
jgi:hypothetical protein